MPTKPTLAWLIDLLEKWFVNDESLPERKREQARIIAEELRGMSHE